VFFFSISELSPLPNRMAKSSKIPAALWPRCRLLQKRMPIPPVQRAERQQRIRDKNRRINAVLNGWLSESHSVASQMLEEFKMPFRQCLDLMFQAGVKMKQECTQTNAWNAFLSQKLQDAAAG
jgi:hypothetical protein